jgi:transcriptional regulator with XRE-family HTH domain
MMVCKRRCYHAMQTIAVLFGTAVRERRQQLGLSQEEFADKAGIHRTYVSSIELGKVQVSITIAHQLAVTLGVPLSKMLRGIETHL